MSERPAGRGLTVPKNPAAMLRALNTQHAEDSETNNLTDKETEKQTNNTTILQTDIPPVEQASPPVIAPEPEVVKEVTPEAETTTIKLANNTTSKQSNKPTKKQTNNTTKQEPPPPAPSRRDGRTLRSRQPASDPTSTIVTSFRISVGTMEALDRYCFENRLRKQDVVEQALAAYMTEDEE